MAGEIEHLLNEACHRLLSADESYTLSDFSLGRREMRTALGDISEALDQARRMAKESNRQREVCDACKRWCKDIVDGKSLLVREFTQDFFDLRLTSIGMAVARLVEELRLKDSRRAKEEAQNIIEIIDTTGVLANEAWCEEISQIDVPDLKSLEEMYTYREDEPQPKRTRVEISDIEPN